jgi:hypothetical protein
LAGQLAALEAADGGQAEQSVLCAGGFDAAAYGALGRGGGAVVRASGCGAGAAVEVMSVGWPQKGNRRYFVQCKNFILRKCYVRKIGLGHLLCLLCLVLAAACSKNEQAKESQSLKPYGNATLTAGVGLGDLRLGEITLNEFVQKFGQGKFSIAAGDEVAFEFSHLDQQLAAQFILQGACWKDVSAGNDLRSATRDLGAYLKQHPGCRDIPLSSLSVARGGLASRSFYTGASEKGAKLGAPITAAVQHCDVKKALPRMVAGLTVDTPSDVMECPGIHFYFTIGRTGKVEDSAIERMTVFLPAG